MIKYGMPTLLEFDTIEEDAALAAELGLDFIELNMNLPQYQLGAIDKEQLVYLSKKYGIFYTIHLDENLDPCDFNDYVSDAYLRTAGDTIALAKQLGVGILNMHLSKGVYFTLPDKKFFLYEKYKDVYLEKIRAFREMCEAEIGGDGIKICIENCSGYQPFHLDAISELLKSDVFALTWDIGHDHCTGGGDGEFILERRDRLAHMHIHDAINSDGIKHDHLALGTGELDIERYLQVAEECGCTALLETKTSGAMSCSVGYIRGGV